MLSLTHPSSLSLSLSHTHTFAQVRHQAFQADAAREQREHEAEQQRAEEFKARPLPDLGRPFKVHESEAPLTVPLEPKMRSDARASARLAFDEGVKGKAQQLEEERRQQEAARLASEEHEVREHRRKLKVQARPVPDFSRPFLAMPSRRQLTNPVTPSFGRKRPVRVKRSSPGAEQ